MSRIPALDGIRAIAVLMVIAFHAVLSGFGGGFIGVDIFFVLSGFLITSLVHREVYTTGRLAFRNFLDRRLTRLYPALFLMLLVFAVSAPFLFPSADLLGEVVFSGLYLTDYAFVTLGEPSFLLHTWSLSVEMQFYLLWPFVIWALHRMERRRVLAFLALLFLMATYWRITAYQKPGWSRVYYAFDTRLSGLILGSMLAFVKWRPGPIGAMALAASSFSVIAFATVKFGFYNSWSASLGGLLVELSTAGLILSLLVANSLPARIFSQPVFVRLGLWSYGLYLWHYPISRLTNAHFPEISSFVITLSISLIASAVSFEVLEPRMARALSRRKLAADMKALQAK